LNAIMLFCVAFAFAFTFEYKTFEKHLHLKKIL
jgi:hypothetical protein